MKIVLFGSKGQLGSELNTWLSKLYDIQAYSREEVDISNASSVAHILQTIQPNIVINAAAYTNVEQSEQATSSAVKINTNAVCYLANLCKQIDALLIHYSTDYVFDGKKSSDYLETDQPNPINAYGSSKLGGENAIRSSGCKHIIFRTSWVIGRQGKNFAKTILNLAQQKEALTVINDQLGAPTSVKLISKVTIEAIHSIQQKTLWENGIYHLSSKGSTNWHEMATTMITHASKICDLNFKTTIKNIKAINTEDYPSKVKRPLNSRLNTNKLQAKLSFELPHWRDDFIFIINDILDEKTYEET